MSQYMQLGGGERWMDQRRRMTLAGERQQCKYEECGLLPNS